MNSILGTGNSCIPTLLTLCHHTHLHWYPVLNAHSGTSHNKPVHSAMGTEEITLAWLQWHALSHFPILTSGLYSTFVSWKVLCCHSNTQSDTQTHTDTHTISLAIKRALPVWVLHLVSVFSTDCSGSGVSLLVLLMWREDTCGCWIERHKGFQIGNV